jgi:hypothetical protein
MHYRLRRCDVIVQTSLVTVGRGNERLHGIAISQGKADKQVLEVALKRPLVLRLRAYPRMRTSWTSGSWFLSRVLTRAARALGSCSS